MDMPDLSSLPMREVITFGLAHLPDEDDDDTADETPYQAALAELHRRDDESTFNAMMELCASSDPDRRYLGLGVLGQLGYQRGRPWLEASLPLMADPDGEVRDWATCMIGATFEDLDGPAIRDALAARIDDEAGDTAGEAVLGLAIRKDQRAFDPIAAWLHRLAGRRPPTLCARRRDHRPQTQPGKVRRSPDRL